MGAFEIHPTSTLGKIGHAVFFLIGIGFCVKGALVMHSANASNQWPQVEGTIIESTIEELDDEDGTVYRAKVEYTYEFAGIEYSSSRISFGDYSSRNRSKAKAIIEKYPVGDVLVYCDADNPQEAVLEKGLVSGIYFWWFMGGVFMLTPVIVFLYWRRKSRE